MKFPFETELLVERMILNDSILPMVQLSNATNVQFFEKYKKLFRVDILSCFLLFPLIVSVPCYCIFGMSECTDRCFCGISLSFLFIS